MIFMPDDSLIDKDKVPDMNTTSYVCAHCGQIYDPGYAHVCHASRLIAEALAARDKWWVEQIERYEAMLNRNLDSHSIIIPWASWQSLKQSILELKQ